jgi:hypothetical protein
MFIYEMTLLNNGFGVCYFSIVSSSFNSLNFLDFVEAHVIFEKKIIISTVNFKIFATFNKHKN